MPPLVNRDGSSSYMDCYVETNAKMEMVYVRRDMDVLECCSVRELHEKWINSEIIDCGSDETGLMEISNATRDGKNKQTYNGYTEYDRHDGEDEWDRSVCSSRKYESIRGSIISCHSDDMIRQEYMASDNRQGGIHGVDQDVSDYMLGKGAQHASLHYDIDDDICGDTSVDDMRLDVCGEMDVSSLNIHSENINRSVTDALTGEKALYNDKLLSSDIETFGDMHSDMSVKCENTSLDNGQLKNDVNEVRQEIPVLKVSYGTIIVGDVDQDNCDITIQQKMKDRDVVQFRVPCVRQNSFDDRQYESPYVYDVHRGSSVENVRQDNYTYSVHGDTSVCDDRYGTSINENDTDFNVPRNCSGHGRLADINNVFQDSMNLDIRRGSLGDNAFTSNREVCREGIDIDESRNIYDDPSSSYINSHLNLDAYCGNEIRYDFLDKYYTGGGITSDTYCCDIDNMTVDKKLYPAGNCVSLHDDGNSDYMRMCGSGNDRTHEYIDTQFAQESAITSRRQCDAIDLANVQDLLIEQTKMCASLSSAIKCNAILPKLGISSFTGNVMQFCRFMASFDSLVGSVLDDSMKLNYLIQFCDGIAKESIEDCVLLDPKVGYHTAREILNKRFGDGNIITHAFIDNLVNGPIIESDDADGLMRLSLDMHKCHMTLKSLSRETQIDNTYTLLQITRRLPFNQRQKWAEKVYDIENSTGAEALFKDLMAFVEKCSRISFISRLYGYDSIESDECLDIDDSRFTSDIDQYTNTLDEPSQLRCSTDKGQSQLCDTGNKLCHICSVNHTVEQCPVFKQWSVGRRTNFLRDNKLCFNCLACGHIARRCIQESNCGITTCASKHHILLHKNLVDLHQYGDDLSYNVSRIGCYEETSDRLRQNVRRDTGARVYGDSRDTGARVYGNNRDTGERDNVCEYDRDSGGFEVDIDTVASLADGLDTRMLEVYRHDNDNEVRDYYNNTDIVVSQNMDGDVRTVDSGIGFSRECMHTSVNYREKNFANNISGGSSYGFDAEHYTGNNKGFGGGGYADSCIGLVPDRCNMHYNVDLKSTVDHVDNATCLENSRFMGNSWGDTKSITSHIDNDKSIGVSGLIGDNRGLERTGHVVSGSLGDKTLTGGPRKPLIRGQVVNGVYVMNTG